MRISDGAATTTAAAMAREDPGEDAQQAPEKGEPRMAAGPGQHGNKCEHDAVDDHRIQGIDGAHGDGEGIGAAMGAEQVRRERHAQEAEQVAGDQAGQMTSPPRTSGLSTARFRTRSALNGGVGWVELMARQEIAGLIARQPLPDGRGSESATEPRAADGRRGTAPASGQLAG